MVYRYIVNIFERKTYVPISCTYNLLIRITLTQEVVTYTFIDILFLQIRDISK